jgi:hypothetical protein
VTARPERVSETAEYDDDLEETRELVDEELRLVEEVPHDHVVRDQRHDDEDGQPRQRGRRSRDAPDHAAGPAIDRGL